jgi:polysaccharide biosynthesis transport protein
MNYFYQAMQRETGVPMDKGQVVGDAVGVLDAENLDAPVETASDLNCAANSFTIPPSVERIFAVPATSMTKERIRALEQCRALRSRVLEAMRLRQARTLMMASSVGREGKTTTAINLAIAASQVEGIRVLLVDTDLREPMIAETLGIPAKCGLGEYLKGAEPIANVVWRISPKLAVVPSVGVTENSAELLHSRRMRQFVEEAKRAYDLVIFDAPPLPPLADAQVLAAYLDAAVMCIRADSTPIELVSNSISMIKKKVIGVVLVGSSRNGHEYRGAYHQGKKRRD